MSITGSEWIVVAAGISAIAWVNWYFFVAGRTSAAMVAAAPASSGSSVAQQTITVDGGYSPAQVRVKAGAPVRLVFDRKDTGSCSEEVVFPDFGLRRFLPTGQQTVIEVTPDKPGRYEFTCGMGMLRGSIVAES